MRRCAGRSRADPGKHKSRGARKSDTTGTASSGRQLETGGQVQYFLHRHALGAFDTRWLMGNLLLTTTVVSREECWMPGLFESWRGKTPLQVESSFSAGSSRQKFNRFLQRVGADCGHHAACLASREVYGKLFDDIHVALSRT